MFLRLSFCRQRLITPSLAVILAHRQSRARPAWRDYGAHRIAHAAESSEHVGNVLITRLLQHSSGSVRARPGLTAPDDVLLMREIRLDDADKIFVHNHAAGGIGKSNRNIYRALRMPVGKLAFGANIDVNNRRVFG